MDALARWLVLRSLPLCRTIAYLAALLVATPMLYHLSRGSLAYLGLLEDDYFYYAIVADKLVSLGKLTYDGVTITNGFHPLWFLVVLLLRLLAGGLDGTFYMLLTATFVGSCVVTYELSRALARSLGASAPLAAALPLLHCVATDCVVSSGMETALDVPLLLWLVLELSRTTEVTARRAAWLGLVSSAAILARLDVALIVPLFFGGWLLAARPPWRQVARSTAAFCAAGVAVPAYAAFNLLVFGSIMPVSALAKQLVARRGVNMGYLKFIAFSTPYGHAAGATLVLGALAAWLAWRRPEWARTSVSRSGLLAAAAVLAFAALFFAINSLSGWTYFGWYAYPLCASLLVALTLGGALVAGRIAASWRPRASATVIAAACGLAVTQGGWAFATRGPLWTVDDNGLLAMSVELAEHMQGREGTFAMGAIGGFATYLLGKPVVQLEGLVGDRAMVEHIGREDDVGDVLRDYGVDYLIVSLYRATIDAGPGCYEITQPNAEWSGKRVHRMRGTLCAEPIAHFETRLPKNPWSMFSRLDTYVFDVRGARWKSAPRP